METIRKLQDTAVLQEEGWHEAATEMLSWDWNIRQEIESYGCQMADMVVAQELTIVGLREGIRLYADLNRQLVRVIGVGGFEDLAEDDQIEATARRLSNGASTWALGQLMKDSGDGVVYRVNRCKYANDQDMTRLRIKVK